MTHTFMVWRAPRLMGMAAGVLAVLVVAGAAAQGKVLDDFRDVSTWRAAPSEGVSLTVSGDVGHDGRALRLDLDFQGHGGWVAVRKVVSLELPENYEFSFWIRGEAPVEDLQFKLVDASGENVWWSVRRDFTFPAGWTRLVIRKRQIEFAWGPAQGAALTHAAAIEFTIAAGHGGRGTVWISDLELTPLPPVSPYTGTPRASASSSAPGFGPERAIDGDSETCWHSAPGDEQWLALDFGQRREFGGLVVDFDTDDFPTRWEVQLSDDGAYWRTVRVATDGHGGRAYLATPDAEASVVRLRFERSSRGRGYGVCGMAVQPLELGVSPAAIFAAMAADARRGLFPRGFRREQAYWTVVGVDGGHEKALLGEDGALEAGDGAFSVEPFVHLDGSLVTWADVETSHTLADGYLPIPTVTWRHTAFALDITAVASGPPDASTLLVRYRLRNTGTGPQRLRLFLAIRPFRVTPPWQALNLPNVTAPIRTLARDSCGVVVNRERRAVPLTAPSGFGATTFDAGDVSSFIARGVLPAHTEVDDPTGHASGALAYDLALGAGESRDELIAIPLHPALATNAPDCGLARAHAASAQTLFDRRLAEASTSWHNNLDRLSVQLPSAAAVLTDTLKSNLAWILVERQGPALQPGTRTYARSWIRDGAMMAAALLRLGHVEEVREYIEWFAPSQFPDGKVPCCVDTRGADPVAENDSHGEFLHLVAEYIRFSGDRELLAREWPRVENAVAAIEALRQQRRTAAYRAPEKRVFFGLLPESISHEGYSAKPMHSYWDDFWALRGLEDAVELAALLGRADERARWGGIRDSFRRDLLASIERAMAEHGIATIPGCAELGDFDPTSTTVALAPGGELPHLPPEAVRATFERYWREFVERRDGRRTWDAYTPYELRTVGTFVRLGWRQRANELLDFFMAGRRPAGWNAWAEVVWHDPRAPKFIGDEPHAWVGSDFIRSFLDLLAYEREADGALVVGAGVPPSWLAGDGVRVHGLRTRFGSLDFTETGDDRRVEVRIAGDLRLPSGGVVVSWPLEGRPTSVTANGQPVVASGGEVVVRALPANVVMER